MKPSKMSVVRVGTPVGEVVGARLGTGIRLSEARVLAPRLRQLLALLLVATATSLTVNSAAEAQQALPIVANNTTIAGRVDPQVFTIDLGTVPIRPVLKIEISPDAAHQDAFLSIRVDNWTGNYNGGGSVCPDSTASTIVTEMGDVELEVNALIPCQANIDSGFWNNKTVDVTITAPASGAAGYPLDVDISIRGITRVPTHQ